MTTRTDYETRFTQMGKNIDEMINDEREEYREERQELKRKWDTLESRRAEASDDSAWERIKGEMDEGWDDVKRSFDDLKRRLSS